MPFWSKSVEKDTKKPTRGTREEGNIKIIDDFIKQYGLEGVRGAIDFYEKAQKGENSQEKGKIAFDIVFTKEDLKDSTMNPIIMQILALGAGGTPSQSPAQMLPGQIPEATKKLIEKFTGLPLP